MGRVSVNFLKNERGRERGRACIRHNFLCRNIVLLIRSLIFLKMERTKMARKRRFIQAGFCYHVMLRGNGGQDIFKDDADRTRFCLLLQYAKEKHQFNIHGFCLMRNHVHFIISTSQLKPNFRNAFVSFSVCTAFQ